MADTLDDHAPALARACAARQLLVFAGSGISKAPPACLPNWTEFNESLLDPIKASALSIPGFDSRARGAIDTLKLDDRRALSFSEFLARELAGSEYLSVLQVLDGETPNDYHAALAALARTGILRAMVTTNFDTLIERAFRDEDVALTTYVTADDYRRGGKEGCALFKIHGSATSTSTLKDTVSQKLRGLPLYMRARLRALYQQHHVLVVGFSGLDLEFGGDYLGFSAVTSTGPGVTWMLRPPASASGVTRESLGSVSAAVQAVIRRAGRGGAVIEADLLYVASRLGARWSLRTVADPKAAQESADRRAREWAATWFAATGKTPLQCALFCSQFLRSAGRQEDADVINTTLEAHLDVIRAHDALSAANLLLVLADNAKEHGDPGRIERLSRQALRLANDASPAPSDPQHDLWTTIEAAAWSNIGHVHLTRGDRVQASESRRTATSFAATLDDPTMLGSMLLNEAVMTRPDELERRLELIRQGAALTRRGQPAEAAYVDLQYEALTLIALAEYDPALRALDEARRFLALANQPVRGMLSIEVPAADIMRLRGDGPGALRHVQNALKAVTIPVLLGAQVRINLLEMLESDGAVRSQLVGEIDWILERMAEGAIPGDGNRPNLPSRAELEIRRARLEREAAPAEPPFTRPAGPPRDAEDAWRQRIVRHEYRHELSDLASGFDTLSRFKYEQRNAWRLYDTAIALVAAAERSGDGPLGLDGLHRKSIAEQNLGDVEGSIASLRAILEARVPAPPSLVALAQRNLGTGFSKLGNQDESEKYFRAAIEAHTALGEFDEAVAAIFDYADARARVNDFPAALRELDAARDLVVRTGNADLQEALDVARSAYAQYRDWPDSYRLVLPDALATPDTAPLDITVLEAEQQAAESPGDLCHAALDACRSRQFDRAAEWMQQAQAEYVRLGDRLGIAECIHTQGEIARARGYWAAAREQAQWALDLRTRLGDVGGQIDSGALLALAWFQLGEYPRAGDLAQSTLALGSRRRPSPAMLIAWCVLADVVERIGSVEQWRGLLMRFLQDYPDDDREPQVQAVRHRFAARLA